MAVIIPWQIIRFGRTRSKKKKILTKIPYFIMKVQNEFAIWGNKYCIILGFYPCLLPNAFYIRSICLHSHIMNNRYSVNLAPPQNFLRSANKIYIDSEHGEPTLFSVDKLWARVKIGMKYQLHSFRTIILILERSLFELSLEFRSGLVYYIYINVLLFFFFYSFLRIVHLL